MKKEKKIKVVFDTNIWISLILGANTSLMHDLILDKRLEIYASEELAEEIFENLKNRKFSHILEPGIIANFKPFIYESVIFVVPKTKIKICRDPKDDFILELAFEAKADYLITGDRDLLELTGNAELNIIKPADLHQLLKTSKKD